jgi:DNA-binding IclR family transcriptional regulator
MEALTSVEKAVDVLFHLHREPGARGVTAIGRALGLPKSSTHRLLTALTRRQLIERDERGHYRPGIGLVALGVGALDREPVVAAARPVLETEAEELGETVFLVAARASNLVVLDKVEGSGFLRAAPRVGSQVPVHATAVGKLYLAFGEGIIPAPEGPLERFTDATAANPSALDREVELASERGFAENTDEWIPGLCVVAAPILSALSGARMVAALAVAAPTARMGSGRRSGVSERALAAAERIAGRLDGVEL